MYGSGGAHTMWDTMESGACSFDKQNDTLLANNPDAKEEINLIRTGLIKKGSLFGPLRSKMATVPRGSDWST
jgi:hypothetical protein